MNSQEIKRFIMFYQRITLQMIKDLSKSASVVMFLKKTKKLRNYYLGSMKNLSKIFIALFIFLSIEESKANTLFDSLNAAYLKNPRLNAERAKMRASKEEKKTSSK